MKKVGLIGFGRFGQLLFKHLKNRVEFRIYDPYQQENSKNIADGIPFYSLSRTLEQSIIILAVPISHLESVVREISPLLQQGTLVMDVCAVKVYPLKLLKENLSGEVFLLGTHPLFGPDSAAQTLAGHKMIACPVQIPKAKYEKFKSFWKNEGVQIIEMSPEEHDRLIAWSLALTHFLGRGLSRLPLPNTEISTKDFQNLLALIEKINRDTYELFQDMHRYNPFTKEMRYQLLNSLISLKEELDKLQ